MKKIILLAICAVFSTFLLAQKKQINKNRMVEFENGKKYEVETENNNVTLLKIDGQTISKENYSKHQAIIDRLSKGEMELKMEDNGNFSKESSEQTISTSKEGENTAITISGSETENPIKLLVTKEGKIIFNGETLNDGSVLKLKTNKNISKTVTSGDAPHKPMPEPAQKPVAVNTKKRVVLQNEDSVQKVAQEDDEWLADELLKDKIIKNKDNIDFEITEKQLTVNGAVQPENLWKKYKSLYENHGVKFDKNTKININRSTN
jgi:bla regulator protein blaR1